MGVTKYELVHEDAQMPRRAIEKSVGYSVLTVKGGCLHPAPGHDLA